METEPAGRSTGPPSSMSLTPSSSDSEDVLGVVTRRRSAATLRRRERSVDSEEKTAEFTFDGGPGRSPSVSDEDYEYESDNEGSSDDSPPQQDSTTPQETRPDESERTIMKHPVLFDTMEAARVVLDGLENARFFIDTNGRTTTLLSCTSHVDCAAVTRIKRNKDGQYVLSRSGMHTTEPAPVEEQRTGIHKPLLPEIDNLLLGDQGPKTCLNTLRIRHKESPEQLNLLSSTSQLKNRAHKRRKRGDFSITTYADVMEWASPRTCTTKDQFFQHMSYLVESDSVRKLQEPFGDQHKLLVLDCFTDRLDDVELVKTR